jgi:lipoyl synthase
MMIPDWIKIKRFDRLQYQKVLNRIVENDLNTVCVSANCPNRYECFSKKNATFMILGNICTRHCRYCNIETGQALPVDKNEVYRIAEAIEKMKLKYAVITCVSRDDLSDGGAGHFVKTVKAIRKQSPTCQLELLISDLAGNWLALKKIIVLKPKVLNHNLETVSRLFPKLRPEGSYERSLALFEQVNKIDKNIITKSGLMLGLGEKEEDIKESMADLLKVGCQILTLGQYLQPNSKAVKVKKYYHPNEFNNLKKIGEKMGFKKVIAGPLVRSSYQAEKAC